MLNKLLSWFVAKQLRPVLVNWKTTLLGLIVLLPNIQDIVNHIGELLQVLVGVADGSTFDVEATKIILTKLGVGFGLIFAKDSNKSTETSTGVTPPKALPVY